MDEIGSGSEDDCDSDEGLTQMNMKVMLQIWELKMVRSHWMRMICMQRVMMSFNCSKLGILVVVL